MNTTLRKVLTAGVLFVLPFVLQAVLPLNDWLNRVGGSTGEDTLGATLNEYLLGYSTPATGPWYPSSFLWCWFVPLISLTLYYLAIDKSRLRRTGTWLLFYLVPAVACAVIAFGIIANDSDLVPSLADVGFGSRAMWGLFNFVVAALLGMLFTPILASAAVNTRLTPFGR